MTLAFLDGLFDIQCTDHAVFGGRDGQVYERSGPAVERKRFLADGTFPAFGTPCAGFIGVAAEAAIIDHFDLGEQGGQGARGSGFGRAAFAADQHAADTGIHGIQNKSAPHALLTNDGSKGINGRHVNSAAHYIAGD